MSRGHDVQLEHGYTRTANRLEEAMLDADFTGAQFKILRGLVRLTYGWRRKTVTISVPDLAHKLRLSPTGGFRRALTDLVSEGVVLCLARGTSAATPSTYAIQNDFTRWGRYSVAPGRLASIWDERPASNDTLIDLTDPTPDTTIPNTQLPDDTMPLATTDPTGSWSVTPQGHGPLPHRVMV
ncbi:MAG: replication protein, partial [Gemmatimonadaceae bacterium]